MGAQKANDNTADVLDHVSDYLETAYLSATVKVQRQLVEKGSAVIFMVFKGALIILALFFGGIALSIWLGQLVHNTAAGFLFTGLFLLVLFVWLASCRKNIRNYLRNYLAMKLYEKEGQHL